MKRSWPFVLAAALPCAALLLFCAIGLHEWWLISTKQIAVIPTPQRGMASMPEVPAARLVPWILGSAILAATFGWSLWRNSRKAMLAGYVGILVVVALAAARHVTAAS